MHCMHLHHFNLFYTCRCLQMSNKIAHAGSAVSQFHGHEVPALLLAKQVGEARTCWLTPRTVSRRILTPGHCVCKESAVRNNRPAQQQFNWPHLTIISAYVCHDRIQSGCLESGRIRSCAVLCSQLVVLNADVLLRITPHPAAMKCQN